LTSVRRPPLSGHKFCQKIPNDAAVTLPHCVSRFGRMEIRMNQTLELLATLRSSDYLCESA